MASRSYAEVVSLAQVQVIEKYGRYVSRAKNNVLHLIREFQCSTLYSIDHLADLH